jgi:hypothetical protein
MSNENQSQVAQLREQIRLEWQSAKSGLDGLSSGGSRHSHVSAKYRQVDELHEKLKEIVGEYEALQIVIDATVALDEKLETREGGNLCLTTTNQEVVCTELH